MGWWSEWLPWRQGASTTAVRPSGRVSGDESLGALVRYARRPEGTDPAAEDSDRDAVIADLQEDLARLCQQASPLMQRLHLFLSVIEAECQIRVHRGTLPLTNEEFEQLLQAIRAIDGPNDADAALQQRKSLAQAGYIHVPPRPRRTRRRA